MSAPTARGVDHIGLTAPDLAAASRFLVEGLGAEPLYHLLTVQDPPLGGPEIEAVAGLPPGAVINAVTMFRLGQGPGIELFQYTAADPRPAARACDVGWQHLALYVDDLDAAVERARAAGATLLSAPLATLGPEAGPGNRFCFLRAPFGCLLEFVSSPSLLAFEQAGGAGRWKPPPPAPAPT